MNGLLKRNQLPVVISLHCGQSLRLFFLEFRSGTAVAGSALVGLLLCAVKHEIAVDTLSLVLRHHLWQVLKEVNYSFHVMRNPGVNAFKENLWGIVT